MSGAPPLLWREKPESDLVSAPTATCEWASIITRALPCRGKREAEDRAPLGRRHFGTRMPLWAKVIDLVVRMHLEVFGAIGSGAGFGRVDRFARLRHDREFAVIANPGAGLTRRANALRLACVRVEVPAVALGGLQTPVGHPERAGDERERVAAREAEVGVGTLQGIDQSTRLGRGVRALSPRFLAACAGASARQAAPRVRASCWSRSRRVRFFFERCGVSDMIVSGIFVRGSSTNPAVSEYHKFWAGPPRRERSESRCCRGRPARCPKRADDSAVLAARRREMSKSSRTRRPLISTLNRRAPTLSKPVSAKWRRTV